MQRRDFFTTIGSIAIVNKAVVEPWPDGHKDECDYEGWMIHWRGWREPPNQLVTIGIWTAHKDDVETMWYSTTLGVCRRYRELEVLDMTVNRNVVRDGGWPLLVSQSDAKALGAVKEGACQHLITCLRHGMESDALYEHLMNERARHG